MYRLQKSLKKLAADSQATSLRFFGMIRGTQKDYYIAEGEVGEGEDGDGVERPPEFEAKGTGVNKFTYWVSHSSFGAWHKLPDLSPDDIRASRTIKVLFTGDLERTIYTNPYFFGKEKDYLRAQIARISHSTTLVPKGLWKLGEDSKREIVEVTAEDD
jgi:radial spoke head protein 4A